MRPLLLALAQQGLGHDSFHVRKGCRAYLGGPSEGVPLHRRAPFVRACG